MKNLKVSMKLIVSFAVVIVMSVLVGLIGVFGMYRMNVADDGLYNDNYLPTIMAGDISQKIVEQRVYMRNFIVYDAVEDAAIIKTSEDNIAASKTAMDELLKEYDLTIITQEDRQTYDELVKVYRNEWVALLDTVHDLGLAGRTDEAKAELTIGATAAGKIDELTSKLQEVNIAAGEEAVDGNTKLFMTMAIVEGAILLFAVAISMFFALHISRLISKPLAHIKETLLKIGTKGDLKFSDAEIKATEEMARVKDETGQSIAMLLATVRRLVDVGRSLETVAEGDLTTELPLLSQDDTMGMSLKKMVDNLNAMFQEINAASSQVSIGAKQVADGSQSLAQGSTEQASAVEQLSASIGEISEKTNQNAEKAREAANLSGTIKENAEKGNSQMDQMMQAVREINDASGQIGKVIKVIDDIAFQTNILALNAAVEAARAGQHGKGFAVVAEEVRSLAGKSAAAAKDTGSMIENSIGKANLGMKIATETSESLREIVEGINRSAEIVTNIAHSSEEQANAIRQVNTGIDQVAQVVQQNSATAQESAAASEEMSGQSSLLQGLIANFRLRDGGSHHRQAAALPAARAHAEPPAREKESFGGGGFGGGGSFGKY